MSFVGDLNFHKPGWTNPASFVLLLTMSSISLSTSDGEDITAVLFAWKIYAAVIAPSNMLSVESVTVFHAGSRLNSGSTQLRFPIPSLQNEESRNLD